MFFMRVVVIEETLKGLYHNQETLINQLLKVEAVVVLVVIMEMPKMEKMEQVEEVVVKEMTVVFMLGSVVLV